VVTDYAALLRELAVPRLVGTPQHTRVREVLKRELAARGLSVEEHKFSARPSRLFFGVPSIIQGVNLIGVPSRLAAPPRVFLVAHYDSKGQPISMALRLAGFSLLGLGVVGLLLTAWSALVALAGLVIVTQNRVTNDSPGALDNASALVTVLMTFDALERRDVGIIFPDAEEYGLVGARVLARERAELLANAAIVNLDGIDDVGGPTVFVHRRGDVGAAVARALDSRGLSLLPVVVDGIALAAAARECVTVMKGAFATTRVVHTPRDTVERLSLTGAREIAAGLARALDGP
jgi:acetylornithine deacetylase/succinyl-diaminopimelate desuccinylase-like protein